MSNSAAHPDHTTGSTEKVHPTLEKCEGCGREIQPTWPCFHTKRGAVCMRCEGAEIEVFRVSLPGDKGGYIDGNMPPDFFAGMDVGDAYTVHRESIRLLQYLNLPEFGGF